MKVDQKKAEFVATLGKEVSAAKSPEAALQAWLEGIDYAESCLAHARSGLSDALREATPGQVYEIGGLPYKAVQIRNSTKDDAPARYTLRCDVSKSVLERFNLQKKA